MENSIEKIWKDGFLNNEDLVAPKVNDLYNRKSIQYVEKFKRDFKLNLILIMVFAIVSLIGSFFLEIPLFGLLMLIQFTFIAYVGKKELDKVNQIEHGMSSFEYLKTFDRWLKNVITFFTKIYRFFYPTFLLTFSLGMCYSNIGKIFIEKVIEKIPDLQLFYEIPVYWLIGTLVFAVLLSIFAKQLYQLDMNLIYGSMFRKLEDMLADMEELQKDD